VAGGQRCKSKRESRRKISCRNERVGERLGVLSLIIVPCELTGMVTMKAEVTGLLDLVPRFVRPSWFAQGAIKYAWISQHGTITLGLVCFIQMGWKGG
jgi:hypothetical protein